MEDLELLQRLRPVFEHERARTLRALESVQADLDALTKGHNALRTSLHSQVQFATLTYNSVIALMTVVRALIASHPNPATVHAALDRFVPEGLQGLQGDDDGSQTETFETVLALIRQLLPPRANR